MEEIIIKIKSYHEKGGITHYDYLKLLIEVEKINKLSTINKHVGDVSDALYQMVNIIQSHKNW